MTGRDLILYILTNNLEDEPVFNHGAFIGFMTAEDAALKLNAGVATVNALVKQEAIDYIYVGNALFIPVNFKTKGITTNEQ